MIQLPKARIIKKYLNAASTMSMAHAEESRKFKCFWAHIAVKRKETGSQHTPSASFSSQSRRQTVAKLNRFVAYK